MHEKILELAASMVSPTESENALLDGLCAAAEAEITGLFREGVTVEDCGVLFPLAAAILAAASFPLCRNGGGVTQFTAGEVSVRMGSGESGANTAQDARRQALRMLTPYLRDDGFVFLGVQG